MTPRDALAVLGLDPPPVDADASSWWAGVRRTHRRLIAAAHPDRGGDTHRAAHLNHALDVLAEATDAGRHLAAVAATPASIGTRAHTATQPGAVRAHRPDTDDPGDLTRRLAHAASRLGTVTGLDPLSGIVTVVTPPPDGGDLLIEVDAALPGTADTGEVVVVFTLEPHPTCPDADLARLAAVILAGLEG